MPRAERPPRADALVLSCEHGGHTVPARYRSLFRGHARVLASHRGWDPGALDLARHIARAAGAPLVATTVSRLVVECNRSPGHPALFSEFVRGLDDDEKRRILDRYYRPHRAAVERAVTRASRPGRRVVHVGVHTFTPVYDGRRRRVDVGVLFDPRRRLERTVSDRLVDRLRDEVPALRIRRNLPYRGWTDGLTTSLRGRFGAARYAGIELEVSQGLVRAGGERWARLRAAISRAVAGL